ncbi:MAG TPA: single-stranded-DNA-specific exonuclease RecJ [Anaerovoracaceae bacterium]|nr:single-stranded-DNA-specific exonuclease RecJ [Anaerovoracaceae bacterium]
MNEIHPIIREILKKRDVTEEADILEFLSEKPSLTYDPFLLKNLEAGVDFLLSAVKQGRKICIYGDYDADGVASVSLLLEILSHLTDNLTYYIPSRFDEGYGLNKDAVGHIREQGSDLIVTVDCGSVSWEEVEYGKSIGIDFIVTDHHNINDRPADCILINPKQEGCPYPFKHLAGCGVAFKLAQGIQRKTGLSKSALSEVLDLVAIATIGDIVPLLGENRTLTRYGMKVIDSRRRPGLSRLIEAAGLTKGKIKSENIAYIIVPHLNAAGRLLDARIGVELLTSRDEDKIEEGVAVLIRNNSERKKIQEEAFLKCREIIAAELSNDLFYVVAPTDVHEGIAGIVAGKIKEEFGRPAIIVTESSGDGLLKGTGRSIDGLNLYDLLKKHDELFLKFGGHAGACGFLMKSGNLGELRARLNRETEALYQDNAGLFDSGLPIDFIIDKENIDLDLALELEKLAPFGCRNERPLFQIKGVRPADVNFMGPERQHVRFSGLGSGGRRVPCILFRKAQDYGELLLSGGAFDLSGYPDINVWNGQSKIQFVLKSIT